MSRRSEQNYAEKCSFAIWSLIIWSNWLGFLRNEQRRWTELWWEWFIGHVIFDHLINLAFFSSNFAEQVNWSIVINVRLSFDLRSSEQCCFVSFAMSWGDERNYDEKCSFVMWSPVIWSISLSFFEMSRGDEQNYAEKCSFIIWSSIIWSVSLSFLRNQ